MVTTVAANVLAAWLRIATDPAQRWRLTLPRKRLLVRLPVEEVL
jgi:peptide/nickel transport system permease protein